VEDFSILFYLHAAVICLGILCVLGLDIRSNPPNGNFFTNIKLAFGNLPTFFFFLTILLMGMGSGILSNFALLQAKLIGGHGIVLGLMILLSCSSETVFFFFSKSLLDALTPQGMILAALACYSIRFVWYALASSPWIMLPAEVRFSLPDVNVWTDEMH